MDKQPTQLTPPAEDNKPNLDHKNGSWEKYKQSSDLYGKGITISYNYDDDGNGKRLMEAFLRSYREQAPSTQKSIVDA